MKKIKILIFLVMIVGVFFIFNTNCYAGYSFSETPQNIDTAYNIYNVGIGMFSSSSNFLKQLLGFNYIYVPYIVILLYILIQIILMKKYKTRRY